MTNQQPPTLKWVLSGFIPKQVEVGDTIGDHLWVNDPTSQSDWGTDWCVLPSELYDTEQEAAAVALGKVDKQIAAIQKLRDQLATTAGVVTPVTKATPELATIVVVSTHHISPADLDLLLTRDSPFSRDTYNGGVMFNLSAEQEEIEAYFYSLSQATKDLFNWATSTGAAYLRIDQDGPIYPDLPSFDW